MYLKAVPTIFTKPRVNGEWANQIQDAFDFLFQEYEHKFLLMKDANFDLYMKLFSYEVIRNL